MFGSFRLAITPKHPITDGEKQAEMMIAAHNTCYKGQEQEYNQLRKENDVKITGNSAHTEISPSFEEKSWKSMSVPQQKKKIAGVRLINSVYLKHPIALLVLIAQTSENSYSAIGQFSIIND